MESRVPLQVVLGALQAEQRLRPVGEEAVAAAEQGEVVC